MPDSPVYRPHREAPARAQLRPIEAGPAWAGLGTEAIELVSRGDFVTGTLHRAAASDVAPPQPLLLLLHGTGEAADGTALAFAADWARAGLAVALVDLPLHGRRASPKLSARLVGGLLRLERGEPIDRDGRALVEEFVRQATSDVLRSSEALAALPGIDPRRLAWMGLGAGALACAHAVAHVDALPSDVRLRAAVLGPGTGRPIGDALDPGPALADRTAAGDTEPPPLLVFTGPAGSAAPADVAARGLHASARPPCESSEATLKDEAPTPEAAADAHAFLTRHLEGETGIASRS